MLTTQPNPERIAVIFHRVGPYHFARLRAAGRRLDLTLIEIFGNDEVYDWDPVLGADGFKRLTLFKRHPQPTAELTQRLQAALDDCRPEAVAIPGWSDAVAFSGLHWCAVNHVPAIVMSESSAWDDTRKGWKEALKRRLVRMCAAALVGGRAHADYIEQLGIGRERVFFGYDAVDNEYFAQRAKDVGGRRPEIRGQRSAGSIGNSTVVPSPPTPSPQVSGFRSQPSTLPLPAPPFFLASARFVEKKNLPRLIEAYARYRKLAEKAETLKPEIRRGEREAESRKQKAEIWDLVLLGDGQLRTSLESQVSGLKLQDCIKMPGFKQYEELPAYYGSASVFIHASTTEQWGLVVNEAMASGLPVLVSNRCGCAKDLVREGANGFTFDPGNVEELAGLMLKISASNFPLSAFGSESQRIIADWGPERFADGLARAVDKALSTPAPKAGVFDRLLLKLLLRR